MSRSRIIRLVVIVAVLGIVYWQRGRAPEEGNGSGGEAAAPTAVLQESPLEGSEKPTATLKEDPLGARSPGASSSASTSSAGDGEPSRVRGYDRFPSARLVDDEGNDGDSFHVDLGAREIELRLYFVDAPEKYLSDRHEDQRRRVAEQGRELGGLSPEQTVEVGKAAKLFVERELADTTFTVYTYWEQVFDGDRYYGFVELDDGSYLGTRLVESGLARIHTKGPGSKENPVPTPVGRSFHEHRDRLFDLERKAQRADRGAWGL